MKDRCPSFGSDAIVAVGPRRVERLVTRLDHHVFTPAESQLLREQIWQYFNFLNASFILDNIPDSFPGDSKLSKLSKKEKRKIHQYYEKKTFPGKWYDEFAPAFNKAMDFDQSSARFDPSDTGYARGISSILELNNDRTITNFKNKFCAYAFYLILYSRRIKYYV